MTMQSRGTVLITRPQDDCEPLKTQIMAKNYAVICAPFLKVVYDETPLDDLEGYGGLIFTSKNGVRAFCNNTEKRDLPVWTVGDATRDSALEHGFKDVQSASGTIEDLKDIILDISIDTPLLYIRGAHVSQELNSENIHSKILYHTEIIDKIDDEAHRLLKDEAISHVVFFSQRTVDSFVKYIQQAEISAGLKQTQALCLGASMLKSVSVLPWKSVEIAKAPDARSVINLLD